MHNSAASQVFWEEHSWARTLDPRAHSRAECRKCARFHFLVKTSAATFLCAHPVSSTLVATRTWSVTLQQHLDLPLYDDHNDDMLRAHGQEPTYRRGEHALTCTHGFGVVHRRNTVRNAIARSMIKPAGLHFTLEHPFLVEGRSFHPADILAHPPLPRPGGTPGKPTA